MEGKRLNPSQWVKRRLLEFAIGLAAHYIRFLALAPILGAPIMSLLMAGALTQTSEYLGPLMVRILPESMHRDFSGGLMEFSLPIAWHFRVFVFWVPVALGVVEQLSGKRLRNFGMRARIWLYALLPIFGVSFLFTVVFMDVNADRLGLSVVALVLNAVLLGSALLGVGGLMLISIVEDKLVSSLNDPKSPSEREHEGTKPSGS